MNKLLILTSYAKREFNSLRNNEVTMKLLITVTFSCHSELQILGHI